MSSTDRQRIQRVPGARRAKLTPAPGTDVEPVTSVENDPDTTAPSKGQKAASGPNDEQLRRDVPPHY